MAFKFNTEIINLFQTSLLFFENKKTCLRIWERSDIPKLKSSCVTRTTKTKYLMANIISSSSPSEKSGAAQRHDLASFSLKLDMICGVM